MKKILLALSLSGALLSAAPLYAEEAVAPAAVTATEVAPAADTLVLGCTHYPLLKPLLQPLKLRQPKQPLLLLRTKAMTHF